MGHDEYEPTEDEKSFWVEVMDFVCSGGMDLADMEAIRKAIAGKGRLVFIGNEEIILCIGKDAKFKKGEATVVIPDYLQDEGVQKEMMERSLQDQGGE